MMAVAALAACATEETIEASKGSAIGFANDFIDNATKSIDGTYQNNGTGVNALTLFHVYGTVENANGVANIFNEEAVSNETGVWAYDVNKTQYWVNDNTYDFAAVAYADAAGVTIEQGFDGMPTAIAYDATQAADGTQHDLLYAEKKDIAYKSGDATTVKFTFAHLLAKAKFTVKNQMQNGNGNSYKVKNVKVLDAVKTATYNVGGTWTNHAGQHDVTFGDIVAADANAVEAALKMEMGESGASNYERLLIPQVDAALKVSIDVEYYVQDKVNNADVLNDSYTKTAETVHTLEAGRAYNFIITLGNPGEAITFAVEDITDWVEEDVDTAVLISNEAELRNFAEQVNSGAKTYAGHIVKLTNDITLTQPWTPIGVERAAKSFRGTFDGQGYTIYGLEVTAAENAGFFGKNWKGNIENVNFDGATIVGNHYAGVVVAWADGAQNGAGNNTRWSVKNCNVTNSTVTLSVANNDNGDKAGAIVGYAYAIDVLGCSVANTTVKAYRDLGAIVGMLNSVASKSALVNNCVVGENVKLVVDNTVNYEGYTEQSQYNVNSYAGRVNGANSTVGSNNSGAATIVF